MARLQRKRFSQPDEVRSTPNGRIEVVSLDDTVVGRMTYEPGWRWSVDVKPVAGTELCQFHHIGVTMQGRLRVQMPDGTELELGPGEVFEIPPGHDAWVVGDSPWVSVDFEAMRTYGRAAPDRRDRILASILFTDIVDSTAQAEGLGRAKWDEIASRHNKLAERIIDRHRGRLVKTTGDGVLALFDGAERAVQAGADIRDAVHELGLRIRAGVHSGEVEPLAGDVRGLAVHIAARVCAAAAPDEILVTTTVRDVLEGVFEFEDRGEHSLKGVATPRRLFSLTTAA